MGALTVYLASLARSNETFGSVPVVCAPLDPRDPVINEIPAARDHKANVAR
jgi:hypothetical protein